MKNKTRTQPLQLSRETTLQLGDSNLTVTDTTSIPHTLSVLVWCAQ